MTKTPLERANAAYATREAALVAHAAAAYRKARAAARQQARIDARHAGKK